MAEGANNYPGAQEVNDVDSEEEMMPDVLTMDQQIQWLFSHVSNLRARVASLETANTSLETANTVLHAWVENHERRLDEVEGHWRICCTADRMDSGQLQGIPKDGQARAAQ